MTNYRSDNSSLRSPLSETPVLHRLKASTEQLCNGDCQSSRARGVVKDRKE
jgi:hypothetical protein